MGEEDLMKYEIDRASSVAKRAMRKVNNKQKDRIEILKQKKYAMRQYRKTVNTQRSVSESKREEAGSEFLAWAILGTIFLAFLSMSYPQVGILAILFTIIIVAALIDNKLKAINGAHQKELDKKNAKIEQILALMQTTLSTTKEVSHNDRTSSLKQKNTIHDLKITKTNLNNTAKTLFREFPYQNMP